MILKKKQTRRFATIVRQKGSYLVKKTSAVKDTILVFRCETEVIDKTLEEHGELRFGFACTRSPGSVSASKC